MSNKELKPTDAELDVLRVLWEHGPATVREIHQRLPATPHRGYTTVLKLLQIMSEKGLVRRDESQRAHVYSVEASMEQTQQKLLSHMMDKAFDNSMSSLVMRALATRPASKEELAEIRKLLDQIEGESK
ncbi:MAG: BlaI/MecI/CopY family transcriptional regulator [Candidatus Zixiibacteriota bacterium]|nr:MAG: BlaI/MecI/CopY family transcriptional regulator [candidate division Zixibacteria bacterium]